MLKKPKHKGVKHWKRKAWDVFSKYIRLSANTKLGCECYTCGKYYDYKKMDAGHFQPGRMGVFIFDERQVHPQCTYCNRWQKGNWPEYLKHMVNDYGQEEVDKMLESRRTLKKFKPYELEEIYLKYKAKLKQYE